MNDRNVYGKIGNDDRKEFNDLVREYHASLHAFVSHLLKDDAAAEDVVQDVFVNLWLNRRRVDFEVPIRNYLYVSARNLAYNHIRSAQRSRVHIRRFLESEQSVDIFLVEEETTRLLMSAISQLPPRTAEIIRLSMEGLKQNEIAERMNVTVANVKLLKSHGIQKLRDIIRKYLPDVYSGIIVLVLLPNI